MSVCVWLYTIASYLAIQSTFTTTPTSLFFFNFAVCHVALNFPPMNNCYSNIHFWLGPVMNTLPTMLCVCKQAVTFVHMYVRMTCIVVISGATVGPWFQNLSNLCRVSVENVYIARQGRHDIIYNPGVPHTRAKLANGYIPYPSLWLLISGLNSHFLPLFPLQGASKISIGQQYLTLRLPLLKSFFVSLNACECQQVKEIDALSFSCSASMPIV